MSYDFEDGDDRSAPVVTDYKPQPHDLETIVTLLELAAIFLTNAPGDQFTYQQLIAQARDLAGNDFVLEDVDAEIVFNNLGKVFQKEANQHYSLK
jgi:hypothetical protein